MGSAWATGCQSAGGTGYIIGLPENVDVRIGSPETPALFSMGDVYQYGQGGLNIIAPTNGSFSAHLSTLRMGLSRRDGYSGIKATLDLRATRLDSLVVEDIAMVGCWTNTASGFRENDDGQGRLYLPSGKAEFKGPLHVGDTRNDSYGLLDLTGTRVLCRGPVEIGTTGDVVIRMQGQPAGLDITSTATNALAVVDGGSIAVYCEAPAESGENDYWGLRMAGDRRAELQDLADAGTLTWDASALDTTQQARFGLYYDALHDVTILGLQRPRGTMLILR
jgi:hypothetical protein